MSATLDIPEEIRTKLAELDLELSEGECPRAPHPVWRAQSQSGSILEANSRKVETFWCSTTPINCRNCFC